MKKFVFASVMALATISLVAVPKLQSQQDQSGISIKDPAEFNAYTMADTQPDPKQKAAAFGHKSNVSSSALRKTAVFKATRPFLPPNR